MAESGLSAAPQPSAREIELYTGEELDRYLKDHGRMVSVKDPENISPEFVQRLRDIVERSRKDVQSHAVDLDEVAARLQGVPTKTRTFDRSPSIGTTEPHPTLEELNLESLRHEFEAYPALIEAGGRPPYPFPILEDFFWNLENYAEDERYRDVTNFWRHQVHDKVERTAICACLLLRWTRFRRAQQSIRANGFSSEAKWVRSAYLDSWELFLERSAFDEWAGEWDFQKNTKRMKARFVKYGFNRPFELQQDLDQQDNLTTWIEYLGFEYYFYDYPATYVKRFQPRLDKAWKELVDSNLLRPEETLDVICDVATASRLDTEIGMAEKAVESATAAVLLGERAIMESKGSKKVFEKQLSSKRTTLIEAKDRRDYLKARDNVITTFLVAIKGYRRQKEEADRHHSLIRWITKQISDIVLDCTLDGAKDRSGQKVGSRSPECSMFEQSNEAAHSGEPKQNEKGRQTITSLVSPTIPHLKGNGTRKRRRDASDDEQPSKRSKTRGRGDQGRSPDSAAIVGTTVPAKAHGARKPKRGEISTHEQSPAAKPLRRSTRIAERENKSASGARLLTHDVAVPPQVERAKSSQRGRSQGHNPRSGPKRKRAL